MSFNHKDLQSLFRYALSLTHRDEWAYDLVSHSVEKVLSRPFILNKKAYAKKCIRNKFFDEYKREEDPAENIEEQSDFSQLEQATINKDQILKLLDQLGAAERELLYLWAVEDYTLQEVSKLTGVPRGTLTSRLSRLKKKLQQAKENNNNE